jgi:divalent metal cation (Fe/Co/Zn/Cd) transporter
MTDGSPMTSQNINKWRNAAIYLTLTVTVVSLIFSILFFTLSSKVESSSLLSIAFDAFFAIFGAVFVVWRFWSPQEPKNIILREKAGTLFFGIAFILSGTVTFGISTYRLFDLHHSPKPVSIVFALGVFTVVTGILTYFLYLVARKLNSAILMALTIDTLFACILSFGVFSTQLVYLQAFPKLWYLDHAVSVAVSMFFVLCGISLITKMCKSSKKAISQGN